MVPIFGDFLKIDLEDVEMIHFLKIDLEDVEMIHKFWMTPGHHRDEPVGWLAPAEPPGATAKAS